jgi:hypothetical protein
MRPLVPAAFELRLFGGTVLLCGLALGGRVLPGAERRELEAAGLALGGVLLLVWGLWAARAASRAARLALPLGARWVLEATGATVARVLLVQVLPVLGLAAAVVALGGARADEAPAGAAGGLVALGLTGLLVGARVRAAERARGRRLLREPRLRRPLDRRAFYLEPQPFASRPSDRPATPWPGHRPPPRAARNAIELEPSNGAAVHPAGVRYPRAGAGRAGGPPATPPADARGRASR